MASTKDTPPQHTERVFDLLRNSDPIRSVADALVQLAEARQNADYDHLARFTRARALDYVSLSEKSVETVDQLESSDTFKMLLAMIALRTSKRG